MDRETAAVAMDYAPPQMQTMWGTTALTRAELTFQEEHTGEEWQHILDNREAFGMAVELRYRGYSVGPNGYDTDYELSGYVDDTVIDHDEVDVDPDIAAAFADIWADELHSVIEEAQESTTLSAKEFAAFITFNSEPCSEPEAADALGISVGTYRGKRGRIKTKQDECSNTATLEKLLNQPHQPAGYERTIGDHGHRPSGVTPNEIYKQQREPLHNINITKSKFQIPVELPRESPTEREHSTYELGHWRTAHVEGVDQVFVADTSESDRTDDVVRIDFDGTGHPGADMHQKNENVQVSAWFDRRKANQLYEQLGEQLDK